MAPEKYACPSCGGKMVSGYLHGNKWRIRWHTTRNRIMAWTGEALGKRTIFNSPSIKAWRCRGCQVGVFSYGDTPIGRKRRKPAQ